MSPHAFSGAPDEQIRDLKRLLDVTRHLGATVDLVRLLDRIAEAALAVLNCERATVFTYDRSKEELCSRVATGVADSGLTEIRFPVTRGIAGESVRTGTVIEVPDAYADPNFNRDIDRASGFRTRNILTCPLWGHDNSVVGVIQALNKKDGAFTPWDHDLIEILGAQAGVALQRQFLLDEFATKQRMEYDLNVARDIQQALLPKSNPQIPGFDVAGWNKPADATGGDCFDFMPLKDGSLAVTIADATGHGIGPALIIAQTRALFRAAIYNGHDHDLAGVVTAINELLCHDLPDDRFITAFFGLLAPGERRLTYSSAGHGPIIAYRAQSDSMEELPAQGLPLGILPDAVYEAPGIMSFAPGDMMVLFTDGFYEWQTREGQFGQPRVESLIRRNRERPAADLIQLVYQAILDATERPQTDDLTAIIIKKT